MAKGKKKAVSGKQKSKVTTDTESGRRSFLKGAAVVVVDKVTDGAVAAASGVVATLVVNRLLPPAAPPTGVVQRDIVTGITVVREATATARGFASVEGVGEAIYSAGPVV